MMRRESAVSAAVVSSYVRELEQVFARDRLTPYYPNDGDELELVVTYYWNVVLCKELHPTLGAVEVTMRNAIHDTLTAHFGSTPAWYDRLGLLQTREKRAIEKAKKDIREAGKTVTPGRVVAAVTFGF